MTGRTAAKLAQLSRDLETSIAESKRVRAEVERRVAREPEADAPRTTDKLAKPPRRHER